MARLDLKAAEIREVLSTIERLSSPASGARGGHLQKAEAKLRHALTIGSAGAVLAAKSARSRRRRVTNQKNNAKFAAFIRTKRVARGLNQAQVAEAVGVANGGVVSNWETGVGIPHSTLRPKLADALGIAAAALERMVP
jgi:ribosome-binding protein aMBF1 (putative translation factor)